MNVRIPLLHRDRDLILLLSNTEVTTLVVRKQIQIDGINNVEHPDQSGEIQRLTATDRQR
jgi:hypothetical protein